MKVLDPEGTVRSYCSSILLTDSALSRLELVSCPTLVSPLSGGEGKSVLVDKDVEEMYFTYRHDSQKRDRGLMTLRHSRMRSTSTCTSRRCPRRLYEDSFISFIISFH